MIKLQGVNILQGRVAEVIVPDLYANKMKINVVYYECGPNFESRLCDTFSVKDFLLNKLVPPFWRGWGEFTVGQNGSSLGNGLN